MGLPSGEGKDWYVRYIENKAFENACERLKNQAGVDVAIIIVVCLSLNVVRKDIPAMAKETLEKIKAQATSSTTLGPTDLALQLGLLRLMKNSTDGAGNNRINFSRKSRPKRLGWPPPATSGCAEAHLLVRQDIIHVGGTRQRHDQYFI